MADGQNPLGAKPAPALVSVKERRDIAVQLAAAILTRQSGRSAGALAREAQQLTDELIAVLEKGAQ